MCSHTSSISAVEATFPELPIGFLGSQAPLSPGQQKSTVLRSEARSDSATLCPAWQPTCSSQLVPTEPWVSAALRRWALGVRISCEESCVQSIGWPLCHQLEKNYAGNGCPLLRPCQHLPGNVTHLNKPCGPFSCRCPLVITGLAHICAQTSPPEGPSLTAPTGQPPHSITSPCSLARHSAVTYSQDCLLQGGQGPCSCPSLPGTVLGSPRDSLLRRGRGAWRAPGQESRTRGLTQSPQQRSLTSGSRVRGVS